MKKYIIILQPSLCCWQNLSDVIEEINFSVVSFNNSNFRHFTSWRKEQEILEFDLIAMRA